MGENIKARIEAAKERIRKAAMRAGRNPEDIRILAATKKVPPAGIIEAVRAGIHFVGENIVQEAEEKFTEILCTEDDFFNAHSVERHFIGHLQRNKVKRALELFDVIESVDSFRLAERISRISKGMKKRTRIFLEVNIAGEENKYGFAPDILPEEAERIVRLDNIAVEGLMCVPPANSPGEELREYFRLMSSLRKKLGFMGKNLALSMGMSNDFEIAVEEGATIVRLGRVLFGERR